MSFSPVAGLKTAQPYKTERGRGRDDRIRWNITTRTRLLPPRGREERSGRPSAPARNPDGTEELQRRTRVRETPRAGVKFRLRTAAGGGPGAALLSGDDAPEPPSSGTCVRLANDV